MPVHVLRVISLVSFRISTDFQISAADASDSDSGDESGGDEDQKKAQRGSQRINVKFVERFRILEEGNPIQFLPIYANANQKPPVQPRTEEPRARDVPQFRYQDPGCGKMCSSSGGLKNHARTHRRDRQY